VVAALATTLATLAAVKIGLIPVDTPSVDGIQTYFTSEREKWGALVRKLNLQGSM
jgi:hypothetical protein